jgi:2-amino-4-hydroxy-6-hydroxymethyldihydropteridine diphosphokinase
VSPRVLLGLGSNLGDRDANLVAALDRLEEENALLVLALSTIRTTAPVGGPPQPDYRNAAALAETHLPPRKLLAALQRAEERVGRRPGGERWGPREVDVDLLLYGDEVIDEPGLSVPHPRMAERRFVLEPAAEIAPEMVHPTTRRTVRQLFEALA